MLYCDRCGTKLEENARFCQKCGAPVATFAPPAPSPPPPARSLSKDTAVIIAIVLVAILVVAIIVIAVFFALYPVNFSQSNQGNGNVNQISLNFRSVNTQFNALTQNIMDKNSIVSQPVQEAFSSLHPV
jgi:uncharacterized membrane protein YvbJ